MAITREVLNIQVTYGESITLYRPYFSKWELVDQKEVPDGKEAVYRLIDGDPAFPATIRIGSYEKNGKKTTSAKLTTWVKVTDDANVVTYHEDTYVMSHTDASGQAWGKTNDTRVFGNLAIFAGFIPPLAAPTLAAYHSANSTLVDRIKFGIPAFDPEIMPDPDLS